MSNTFNIVGPPASSPARVSAGWRVAERPEPTPAPPETEAVPRRGEATEAGAAASASLAAAAINAVIVTPPAGAPVGASPDAGRNNGALATRALQSYRAVDDTSVPRMQSSQADTSGALTSRSGRLMAVTSNQDPGPVPLNVFLDALARAFSSASPTVPTVPPVDEPGAAAVPDAAAAPAARASAAPPAEQRVAQRQLQAYAEAGPSATPAAATPSRVDA